MCLEKIYILLLFVVLYYIYIYIFIYIKSNVSIMLLEYILTDFWPVGSIRFWKLLLKFPIMIMS